MIKDIKNYILEALSQTWIFEMAYSRQDYLRNISGLCYQIVENWCLIKYCNLYDEVNYNRLHWSNELIAHLENLRRCQLKSGLDKYKTTKFGFVENAELDNIDIVDDVLELKWDNEKLPNDTKRIIAKEFIDALPKLFELISGKSVINIKNYVYNEI